VFKTKQLTTITTIATITTTIIAAAAAKHTLLENAQFLRIL
jgi:hypothetical protein